MPRLRFIAAAVMLLVISPMATLSYSQENYLQMTDDNDCTTAFTDSLAGRKAIDSSAYDIWSWSLGTDIVTSYIWRGARQGRGPHLQPYAGFSAGPVTGGVWGTFDFNGYREVDLYLAMELPGGFIIGLQDYWMADLPFSDFTAESGSHVLEASLGYDSEHISLNANYIINEAGGAGSVGDDLYVESRFSFEYFSVFMGAGNGWHTEDGRFMVCNVGIGAEREFQVSDSFSIPVTAQICYNPDSGRAFFAAGLSISTGR